MPITWYQEVFIHMLILPVVMRREPSLKLRVSIPLVAYGYGTIDVRVEMDALVKEVPSGVRPVLYATFHILWNVHNLFWHKPPISDYLWSSPTRRQRLPNNSTSGCCPHY